MYLCILQPAEMMIIPMQFLTVNVLDKWEERMALYKLRVFKVNRQVQHSGKEVRFHCTFSYEFSVVSFSLDVHAYVCKC